MVATLSYELWWQQYIGSAGTTYEEADEQGGWHVDMTSREGCLFLAHCRVAHDHLESVKGKGVEDVEDVEGCCVIECYQVT